MADALKNPRIQELLRELVEAQELASRIGPSVDLDEAIDRLHRDLGKALAQFARVHAAHTLLPPDPGPLATQDLYTADDAEDDGDDWYDDPPSRGTLFDPGDLDDTTDIPESDPRPLDDEEEYDDLDVETVASMQRRRADPDSPMSHLTAEPPPTWLHHAQPFRDLLALPDEEGPDSWAVEATRVQWASSELVTRLDGLPAEVQVCFLGLLAARCQRLIEVLEVDVGPRLSLDRMRRYALSNDLPTVAGLDASPRPEYGSWAEDARQWWAVLDMG